MTDNIETDQIITVKLSDSKDARFSFVKKDQDSWICIMSNEMMQDLKQLYPDVVSPRDRLQQDFAPR